MNVIEVNNLVKFFLSEFKRTPIPVLNDITFSVPEGASFGILGPNGAGKTTTMKIILGLLKPSSGSVKILGKNVTDRDIRARIGYMPESPYFYTYLNGYELLNFFADLLGMEKKQKKQRIDELLELVGMTGRAHIRLGNFSKGMLQRIGIAQAILNDPDIVLLDEPMSGLDPAGRKNVKDIILSLKKQNKTVLFNSHVLADVEEICDTVAIFKTGHLIAEESIENIRNSTDFTNLEDYFINIINKDISHEKNVKDKSFVEI